MSAKLNPSRYAHCEGHTGVCFSQDASQIITCGEEGDIRIWNGIEDDEATDKCVGEKAFAVCQRGEKLYVATDQNSVQTLTFPEADLDGVVARFTAPVTHIDASTDGTLLVSASCDMTIGVTQTDKMTTEVIRGHRAPVLSVALDPKLEYLVSSSCDGTIRVWQLKDFSEMVSWNCVPKSNSWQHATALGQTAWLPETGELLAVPGQGRVTIYRRQTWETKQTAMVSNQDSLMLSVVSFSSCGQYLAASSMEGHIILWRMPSLNQIICLQTDEKQHVCSLAWSPQLLQIAFCDAGGNFGTVDVTSTSQNEKIDVMPEDLPLGDPVFGDSDEDDDNAISLEKIKNESGFLGGDITKDTHIHDEDERSSRHSDRGEENEVQVKEQQPPFQSASTPITLQYRYMVWNNIGIVKQTNTEEENVIDVEFHDTTRHHAFRINNIQSHTLAALSEEALVMAAPQTLDHPSKVVCVRLNPWDGNKEWSMDMLGDEEALCVATGQGYLAVVTDTRMLRLFTTCGSQREVVSIPGPVVTLTAHQLQLAVVFHLGTAGKDQSLGCFELSVTPTALLSQPVKLHHMSLTPKTCLRWLGYSDESSLCSLDEAGLLRKLTPSGLWVPICNVDIQCRSNSDHQFVVGVSESFQTISSVLCRGGFYPPTTPRPAVNEIAWQVPLCEGEGDKSRLEQKLWSIQSALPALEDASAIEAAERTLKITILQLFAVACQKGLEARAVGLCQFMFGDMIDLAVKYAVKQGNTQLAKRIMEMSRPQEKEDIEDHSASQDMFAESGSEPTPAPENPILVLKKKLSSSQPESRPDEMKEASRGNPFKKASGIADSGKGLEGMVKQAIEPVVKPAQKLTLKENKPIKAITMENKTKKSAFSEWFTLNKESLQEEFPDLNSFELSKVALKRYREESKPKVTNCQNVKKFFVSSSAIRENTQNDKPCSEDTEIGSKKRKASNTEEIDCTPQSKKLSTASKLKLFSFGKNSQ